MKRIIPLVLALAVCAAGCVEFEDQDLRLRLDPEKDRLDALLVYRGLHAGSGPFEDEPQYDDAVRQLESARSGRRLFVLFGWPFAFDFDDEPWTNTDDPHLKVVAANVVVRSGGLWKDAGGRLCAHQLVRVTNVSKVLAAVNALIHRELSDDKRLGRLARELGVSDARSLELVRAAVAAGRPFIRLAGNAVELRVPLSDPGARAVRRRMARIVQKEVGDLDEDARLLSELLCLNDWSFGRRGDDLRVVIGNPGREEMELLYRGPPGRRPGLASHLAERGWSIAGPGGGKAALEAFARFCREP